MAPLSKCDLSFVEEVPNQIDIECPVCSYILTDPHQVSCCGRNFCQSCIERVKDSNGSCPMCKEERYQFFEDKNISRIINGLQVYCTNKAKGCQWKGDLKYLPTHLNKGKREGDCQYEEVECRYEKCQTNDQRQNLTIHEKDDCNERPYKCEHCALEDRYIFITGDHLNTCPKYPTTCPNNCAQKIPRESISDHLTQCPLEPVDCVFSWVGCNDKPLRKDVDGHANDTKHMTLLAAACRRLEIANKQMKEEMKKENEEILEEMKKENKKIREVMKKENERIKEEMEKENEKIREVMKKENEEIKKEMKKQIEKMEEENKKKNTQISQMISYLSVINHDTYPLLPVTVNRRDSAVHFYTELGGHHMSAIAVQCTERLYLAFHKGKFDKLHDLEFPKILLCSGDAEPELISIKCQPKVSDSAYNEITQPFSAIIEMLHNKDYRLCKIHGLEGVIPVQVPFNPFKSIRIDLTSPNEVKITHLG